MSTTYSYTRNPYDPIPGIFPGYIVMPSDGDPFIAQSANIFEKAIQDRNMYAFESAIKTPTSMSVIQAESKDGSTIQINPFVIEVLNGTTYSIVNYPSQTTISAANLSPAGAFANNTWYYVYLNIAMDNSTSFVITNAAPHAYLLYENNAGVQNKARKFFFSFRVGGAANIIPFCKYGQNVFYKDPFTRLLLNGGLATTPTALALGGFKPPFAKICYYTVTFFNGDTTTANFVSLGDGTVFTDIIAQTNTGTGLVNTRNLWLPCKVSTDELFYSIDHASPMGDPDSEVSIYVNGYIE